MTATVFVDTNVLVYARDTSEGEKHEKAFRWVIDIWNTRVGRVSYQVLHEYYVVVTQKLDPGLSRKLARADVRALSAWKPVTMEELVLDGAWAAQDRYHLSFWDSLIVSAAKRSQADYLLSEDLQGGQDLDGLTIVNPFETSPGDILELG